MSSQCLFVLLLLLAAASADLPRPQRPVLHLHPGKAITSTDVMALDGDLATFCYYGESPNLASVWKSVWLSVDVRTDAFVVYRGENESDVAEQHRAATAQLFSLLPWRARNVRLLPFAKSCVGISVDTSDPFTVQLNMRHVDYSLTLLLAAGLLLFICAPALSTNVVFHYSSGVAVGMFGALLVAVYILSRMVPRKSGALAFLFTGWSLALYMLQYVLENLRQHILKYKTYALGYLAVSGLISFAICYWYGPVKDKRTQTLIKWFLQLVGLVLIYLSSNMPEASMAVIIILVLWQCIPVGITNHVWTFLRRRLYRPRPRKLLTEQEYLDQSSAATRAALDELRQYCRSPECDAWRTVSRLQTPTRFADFVEGASHLSDEEVLEYELEPTVLPSGDDGETSGEEW